MNTYDKLQLTLLVFAMILCYVIGIVTGYIL